MTMRTVPMEPAAAALSARDKGLPARAIGRTPAEFLATAPRLAEFWTPLVVLAEDALRANAETMSAWCRDRGLALMPHGKTTMAPALWQRQLDAGSLGITLATMGQVRTGRDAGLASIMLANSAVDERALRWLADELVDPAFQFVCWADDPATVDRMQDVLRDAAAARPVDVCVELGAPGARTGARTLDAARAVAERIASSNVLRLAGVAGYEGVIGHDRSAATLQDVREYLERLIELHRAIAPLYDGGEVYVTAGGSAFFDVVAEVFRDAGAGVQAAPTRYVLRSGAYLVHDDGFYRGISPFGDAADRAGVAAPRFRTAMHGLARVVSHPEPGLTLLDGGKRDFPYDEGLPVARGSASDLVGELGGDWTPLDASVSAMSDQHTFLRADVPVGAVVRLGLSHPCTAFDKWRVLPVVDSWESGIVVDLIRTYF